jgi:carboxyl-terminal processing protease
MKKIILFMMGVSLICGIFIGRLWANPDTYSLLRIFNKILKEIEDSYVVEVASDSLIRGAINGMIETLRDPHTDYLTKEEYESLMITTKGEFGGIGATIGKREDKITVISPLEGTPAYNAGLLPGDAIIKVDGVSTKGKSVDIVVKDIRGKPGTKVVLSIERTMIEEPFDVEIIRANIKLDAVPYYGMVGDDIGYVQLATFSQTADAELEAALDSLFAHGAQKIIFDLRLNSGGLLKEGVKVSELFLCSEGKDVVITKGRIESETVYKTNKTCPYGDFPLITLVDGGSASASEIVAGALQDWDRSLIMGTTTFGKGSVQKIFPLEDGGALKLTTDRWYTPSGRSIDKSAELLETEGDEDTSEVVEKREFITLGPLKRTVYGEGGITPDVVVEPPTMTKLETDVIVKGYNFDYAVKYTATHKEIDKNFTVDDKILKDFAVYLLEKGLEFTEAQFDSTKVSFKKRLQLNIVTNLWGLKEGYQVRVENDPLIAQAIELLKEVNTTQDLFRFADE